MIKIEPSFPPLSVHKPHFLRMNHSPELGIYPSKRVVKPVLHMHRPGCRDCSIISFLCSPLDYWSLPTFSSVQFSRSVVSDSVRPHESQHARPPCPSPGFPITESSISFSFKIIKMEEEVKTQFLGGTRRISSPRQPDVSGGYCAGWLGFRMAL